MFFFFISHMIYFCKTSTSLFMLNLHVNYQISSLPFRLRALKYVHPPRMRGIKRMTSWENGLLGSLLKLRKLLLFMFKMSQMNQLHHFRSDNLFIGAFQELTCIYQRAPTAWKVSRYGFWSSPYFPVFGLNTDQKKLRIWKLFMQCQQKDLNYPKVSNQIQT